MNHKPLIIIPTYNEKGNVVKIYNDIRSLEIDLDILFVDDASPDGTGALLNEIAKKDKSLFIIHRKNKLGIGSAHKDAITWAYEKGFQIIITMDCDYSHSPDDIPRFIEFSSKSDVVVGTRFMKNSSMEELRFFRRMLSKSAHFMTQFFLRMPYDSTNAFRLYRLDKISQEVINQVASDSYSFFFESLYLLHSNNISINEIPVNLGNRPTGKSKMSLFDALTSLRILTKITFKKYFKAVKYD
jgi:dolichol-phosphate mannosyltransferase